MIVGQYRDGRPLVLLTLQGERDTLAVEFWLDTAFEGALTLPGGIIRRLGGTPSGEQLVRMADGSVRPAYAYILTVDWGEDSRVVEVFEQENNPLLGAELYAGCRLTIEADEEGEVLIEPLD